MRPDDIQMALANGVAFVCATCEHWHKGVDCNMRDIDGDIVCAKADSCSGPLSGGTFSEYKGEMHGHLDKFCHRCGAKATKALQPKGEISKIGVCDTCLEVLRKLTPSQPGRKILFTTERRCGPKKFEEIS